MTRFLVAAAAVFQLTDFSLAQYAPAPAPAPNPAQCDQIRQAVATYGYDAARRHAMANYGAEAVKYGDRCLPARNHKGRG
jgi:hypothetical protein